MKQIGSNSLRHVHTKTYSKDPDKKVKYTSGDARDFYVKMLPKILWEMEEVFENFEGDRFTFGYGLEHESLINKNANLDEKPLNFTLILNLHETKEHEHPRHPVLIIKVRTEQTQRETELIQNYFDLINGDSIHQVHYAMLVGPKQVIFGCMENVEDDARVKYSKVLNVDLNDYNDGKEPSEMMIQFFQVFTSILVESVEQFSESVNV